MKMKINILCISFLLTLTPNLFSLKEGAIGAEPWNKTVPVKRTEGRIYYIDSVNGNDILNDGSSIETAFATIQKGINTSENGDSVRVYPGIYREQINFLGKAITVHGVATSNGIPILENPDNMAVIFSCGEGPDSILKNFVIRNSSLAIAITNSSPTLSNMTIVNNTLGIGTYIYSEPDISSCIFWNNTNGDLFNCEAQYSYMENIVEDIQLEGLVSHWKFDEGNGLTAYDSTGYNHGTIYGAQWTTGHTNSGLSFDGNNDYVKLPDNQPVWLPQNDFTLSTWVYFEKDAVTTTTEREVILDLNYGASSDPENELGYNIQRGDSEEIWFQMTTTTSTDENLTSEIVLDTNTWYHIVAVRGGEIQAIYINGILYASRICSPDPIDFVGDYDDNRVNIGRYTTNIGNPRYHFKGKIDDVMIFEKALSAENIEQLYTNQFDGQNMTSDPLFADPENGDYHLLSEQGRHWPDEDIWILDNITSPCIDSGDPHADYSNEPKPNGSCINIGAYGGTAYASKSKMPDANDVNNNNITISSDINKTE